MSAPAPVRKTYASVFSDLPKDAPQSPGPLQLKANLLRDTPHSSDAHQIKIIGGRSFPRPTPVRVKFSLITNSWVLEKALPSTTPW